MKKIILIIKLGALVVLFSTFSNITIVNAQEDTDLGLCPETFNQGLVDTGFVDCYGTSSLVRLRADAEIDRLEFEAICNATPRSEVTSSEIQTTISGGRFFSRVTCTISRVTPPDTVLCPENSDEVLRAFDTLVCKYFGTAAETMAEAEAALVEQSAECASATGRILAASINMETALEDIPFYFGSSACGLTIQPTDIIECPYSFFEIDRDEDLLECRNIESPFDSLEESQEANDTAQSICTGTTAGLGLVSDADATQTTAGDKFVSRVDCDIRIPRYGDFTDQAIIRACDASCTEEVQQSRECLNGGMVGGVGCTDDETQIIERTCNTGASRDGLCPLTLVPSTVVPLLLDDEEE